MVFWRVRFWNIRQTICTSNTNVLILVYTLSLNVWNYAVNDSLGGEERQDGDP